MRIGGFLKFTLIDYPGKIGAVIFTQGCNFRCGYCHNPELVDPKKFVDPLDQKEIFNFLKKRKNQLEAITITGGEPCLHQDLPEFCNQIKKLEHSIKLDTNGSHPKMVKKLLSKKLIDYIAMDIKAPIEKYSKITLCKISSQDIRNTIKQIMNSKIDYEFRTTFAKELLKINDFKKIGQEIKGAEKYVLQKFQPSKSLRPEFQKLKNYSDQEIQKIVNLLKPQINQILVR